MHTINLPIPCWMNSFGIVESSEIPRIVFCMLCHFSVYVWQFVSPIWSIWDPGPGTSIMLNTTLDICRVCFVYWCGGMWYFVSKWFGMWGTISTYVEKGVRFHVCFQHILLNSRHKTPPLTPNSPTCGVGWWGSGVLNFQRCWTSTSCVNWVLTNTSVFKTFWE